MKIFPAIDIKDKKCVRLIKGDFSKKTEYETSPIDQAGKYKDHGFKNLHIVDLDGALSGKTVNLDVIQEIVGKYDLKIEIGGGIRTIDNIKGLQEELNESVLIKKKPIYGICAGMQLFATVGYEEEKTSGLNWIPGEVIKLYLNTSKFKIPHMGWNELNVKNVSNVFQDVINKSHAYFIHSYEFIPQDKKTISITTDYGKDVIAAVSSGNIFGSQFHPEKSQNTGIKILTNFLNL